MEYLENTSVIGVPFEKHCRREKQTICHHAWFNSVPSTILSIDMYSCQHASNVASCHFQALNCSITESNDVSQRMLHVERYN